jgi:hypothetical protein
VTVDELDEDDREWVRRQVNKAKPLNETQRTALAELLRPARQQQGRR